MKEQKIFRLSTFGNLVAIASVTDDNKIWVRYYDGRKPITDIPNGGFYHRFIKSVVEQVEQWADENKFNLWSF